MALAVMRERVCANRALSFLFSSGYHDCLVRIQPLQAELPTLKLAYNDMLGTCVTLTEDDREVVVGTRDGLVVVWNVEWASCAGVTRRGLAQHTTDEAAAYAFSTQLPRLILPGLPSKGECAAEK